MSKAGNGRYINADNYEERLQRLLLVYEAEGQPDHAAATAVAIRMLQTERAFERVDVRRNLILEGDRILQQPVNWTEVTAYHKERMAEELGKYAVEEGLATFEEAPGWVGGELRMHAAFLRPTEPKFKPDDDSGKEEQEGGEQE